MQIHVFRCPYCNSGLNTTNRNYGLINPSEINPPSHYFGLINPSPLPLTVINPPFSLGLINPPFGLII